MSDPPPPDPRPAPEPARSTAAGMDRRHGARLWPARLLEALLRSDRLTVIALVGLAAALRLPGLIERGVFDADQGRDMLVIYNLVEHAQFPLLGPETISIANSHLHHGAFYWYLFAPGAWLTGGDPAGVLIESALIGIAAVVATWWAGRLMGGRAVAALSGFLLAISPAAVEQSIFLWNPNPIPLFAALATGAAWRAHQTGRARWYTLAIASAVAVYQLHLLGAAFVIGIGLLIAYDTVHALRDDRPRWHSIRTGILGGVVATVVLFLPLIVNELQTGFDETQKLVQFLLHGGSVPTTGGLGPVEAAVFIVIRVIGWPFVGLVLDVPLAAVVAVLTWLTLVTWWLIKSRGEARLLMRWLVAIVAFSTAALTVMAPWLRFVVPGFPTDHYHAFLNPVLLLAVSLAAVAFARGLSSTRGDRPRSHGADTVARLVVALALLGQVAIAAVRQPAPSQVATWPIARSVGQQIVDLAAGRSMDVVGLPDFKSPDSIGFPIVLLGGHVVGDVSSAQLLVVNCDNRFKATALNGPCGGDAEDEDATFLLEGLGLEPRLLQRYQESEDLRVSVYAIEPAG